jgi:hypothetical protein
MDDQEKLLTIRNELRAEKKKVGVNPPLTMVEH